MLRFYRRINTFMDLKFMQAHRDQHGLAWIETSVLDLDLVRSGTVWPGGIRVCIYNNCIRSGSANRRPSLSSLSCPANHSQLLVSWNSENIYIFIFNIFFEKVWQNKETGIERPPKRKILMWPNNDSWRAMLGFYRKINTSMDFN
jgi:hypothetical protein